MKVLFLVRSDFFSTQGGVYIQINKTVENLTSLGIECLITNSLKKVNINIAKDRTNKFFNALFILV